MPQQFPYIGFHFSVFFLFPQFNFSANFQKVDGLGFTSGKTTLEEGGIGGFKHNLTDTGTFSSLTLTRGFTNDRKLYEWCEGTHNTLKTQPCNILVSLLDKQDIPEKNWLIFNAFPTGWTGGNPNVSNSSVMLETINLAYQNFILI